MLFWLSMLLVPAPPPMLNRQSAASHVACSRIVILGPPDAMANGNNWICSMTYKCMEPLFVDPKMPLFFDNIGSITLSVMELAELAIAAMALLVLPLFFISLPRPILLVLNNPSNVYSLPLPPT